MKYDTFIFDFDFTLADASTGIVESVNYACDKLGLEHRESGDIRKTVGMTLRDAFRVLTGISDENLTSRFLQHFKDMADRVMTENTVLFDDTVTVLTKLRENGFKTAIVTSKLNYRIKEVLKKHNITGLFDYIVGIEDVENAKPSPEGLLKAIQYLSADKQNVLYTGDSLIDANTAFNAAVDFAAVTTGTTARSDFEPYNYEYIAKSLTELYNQIFL